MSYTDRMGSERAGGIVASMETTPFSVMCIDDNVLLVDALERRLHLEPEFTGLHRVENLSSVVEDVARLRPSVVLLDMDLPGGLDALSILDQLVEQVPESRVVVFTGFPSGDLVRRSMARGAWGFVSKGTTAEALISAIRRVVAGQAVIELEE
jgi:DNA-binding NarL/FixJ family response regulator